ncbi:MAG: CCA tRNA nucleotidyltransferase [Candidatus Omnitrophota bacterium]
MQNVKLKIKDKKTYNLLRFIGKEADRLGYKAFCVGGFVRDLLLGIKNFDIDIVVEKDAIAFAKALSVALRGTLVTYERFRTATIFMNNGSFRIDIATARAEEYEKPAALPTVKFDSIKKDLYRRDFTINAMAVSLNNETFGSLIDLFGGEKDLKSKKIRALHDLSFVDDPTRIFRAVRFEQRFNFKIEPHTEKLIKTAITLDMFGKTQKQRIRQEIILMLSEKHPSRALLRMKGLRELCFIDERLNLEKKAVGLMLQIEKMCNSFGALAAAKAPVDTWLIFFMALVDELPLYRLKSVCDNFVFAKADAKRLLSAKVYADKTLRLLNKKKARASQIYKSLRFLSNEVILYVLAKSTPYHSLRSGTGQVGQRAKKRIKLYFSKYRNIKTAVDGTDLKRLGVMPGPKYKEILDKLLFAKIDGEVKTKSDELNLVKALIKTAGV